MPEVAFTKMHGQGNDFVLLDGVGRDLPVPSSRQVRALAARHEGVGCDQVLWLGEGASPGEFAYRIWNADGNEVGQCGNGARAAYALLLRNKHCAGKVSLRTEQALVEVEDGDIGPRAHLAEPDFAPSAIPLARPSQQETYELGWEGETWSFASLQLGNPHAVFWVEDVDRAPVAKLGGAMNGMPDFPEGVNVGFATRPDASGKSVLRVYERGVGETKACGSGAAACAVVARQAGHGGQVDLKVPGGRLLAGWAGPGSKAWVEGEVCHVFCGKIGLN